MMEQLKDGRWQVRFYVNDVRFIETFDTFEQAETRFFYLEENFGWSD